MNTELLKIAAGAAAQYGLDPALICSIIEQESVWNPWAARYEPAFFTRYLDKSTMHLMVREFCRGAKFYITADTELRERATSRGLMQMMGQTARETGYTGPIAQLHDPATAAEWGCKFLRKLLDRYEGDTRKALLKWNGGADPLYPDKVFARMEKY